MTEPLKGSASTIQPKPIERKIVVQKCPETTKPVSTLPSASNLEAGSIWENSSQFDSQYSIHKKTTCRYNRPIADEVAVIIVQPEDDKLATLSFNIATSVDCKTNLLSKLNFEVKVIG
jgi:hypothetical protein